MYCKNLLKRQKNYKPIWWCKIKRQQVILPCYENCLELDLVKMRPIKKVSNKRITVSKETYEKVFERDKGCCRLCGTSQNIHAHHIIPRSEDKTKIDDEKNIILLCARCHLEVVHKNMKKYKPILSNMTKGDD
jgi:5-methylcytosine-specific restriction endonuclease McrA